MSTTDNHSTPVVDARHRLSVGVKFGMSNMGIWSTEKSPDIESPAEKDSEDSPADWQSEKDSERRTEKVSPDSSSYSQSEKDSEKQTESTTALVIDKILESDVRNGIVGWDGQEDPDMPLNFKPGRKWLLIGLLATMEFITPLASSMFAPALGYMDIDLHNNSGVLSPMVVTIFVFGFVPGPLFLAPLGEIYGRRPVLSASNVFFVAFQIGCALAPNIGALIAFRFLAGIGGSGCLAVGGGVIADLFPPQQRGLASAVYSIGPIFGPTVGPVLGGFLSQRLSWRWIFWLLLIASGTMTCCNGLFFRETNPRVLMKRKVARLSKELNRSDLRSVYEQEDDANKSTRHRAILANGLKRPLKLLFTSPVVFILATYVALIYGLSFLVFTTLTAVLHDAYGWSPEICGLAYLAIGLGFLCGLVTVAKISDATVVRLASTNGGVIEPEMRLPTCAIIACLIPVSFFWYGWAADQKAYWLVTVIGLVPLGYGMIGVFLPAQTYLIDAFPIYSASALAAQTTTRSLFGGFLALAGPSMNSKLGIGWANSVLGFITLAFVPATALVAQYGKFLRERYPVNI